MTRSALVIRLLSHSDLMTSAGFAVPLTNTYDDISVLIGSVEEPAFR